MTQIRLLIFIAFHGCLFRSPNPRRPKTKCNGKATGISEWLWPGSDMRIEKQCRGRPCTAMNDWQVTYSYRCIKNDNRYGRWANRVIRPTTLYSPCEWEEAHIIKRRQTFDWVDAVGCGAKMTTSWAIKQLPSMQLTWVASNVQACSIHLSLFKASLYISIGQLISWSPTC